MNEDDELAGPASWRSTTLGELCEGDDGGVQTGPFGSQLHAADYVVDGIPSVMPQNIGDNVIIEQGVARITDEDAQRLERYLLREGDIVYSRRGDVEKRAYVRAENDGWLCGTGCLRVRIPPTARADPKFVSYLLGTSEARRWISRHAVGATMLNLNTAILSAVPVRIPDHGTQRAIADVLGALDDKIAANTELAIALHELSRTVFSSMLAGCREIPLTDLARFVNGRAYTKNATGTGRVVVRIAELNSGIGGSTVLNDLDVDDDYLARPGDLLFAWSGSLTLHRWYRDEAIVNQHIFKVVPKEDYPLWLVYQVLERKMEEFRGIAADKATTMGHIQRRHLEEPVPVPQPDAVSRHDETMSALWQRALNAERESIALAELRDTLLPQLMSGRLRVKDAEKQVEAMV